MQIYNRWRSITGILSLVWAAIVSALDWGGRVDYARTHIGDLIGAWDVINLLLAPPLWLFWPTTFAGLGLIWWDGRRQRSSSLPSGKRSLSVDPYLIFAAIGFVTFIVCGGLYFAQRKEKIDLNLDKTMILGASQFGDEPIVIVTFQFSPTNNSDMPIDLHEAYIQSNLDLSVVNLRIIKDDQLLDPREVVISPDSKFSLSGEIPGRKYDPISIYSATGLRIADFLNKYSDFTLHLSGKEFSIARRFREPEVKMIVDRLIHNFEESSASGRKLRPGYGVQKKP